MLVSKRALEAGFAGVGALGFATAAYCLGLFAADMGTPQSLGVTIVIVFAAGCGGLALASSLLYRLAPELDHPRPNIPDAAREGTDVIVLACYEPETYDPRYTADALHLLEEEQEVDLSIGMTPVLYTAAKARYRAAGGSSPSRPQLVRLAEKLQDALSDSRPAPAVTIAACTGAERLAAAVATAVEAGSKSIVVALLGVGESLQVATAKREVDTWRLHEHGIEVSYTAPLWGSDRVAGLVARRIENATTDPATTGVVLVVHGQNDHRSQRNPEFDENEAAFASRIRLLVNEKGIPEANVRTAWAGWHEPDVTSTVRHLAALGCSRILVVPATYPLETISTVLDFAAAARSSRVDGSVAVVSLPAWRDDAAVAEELAVRVREFLPQSD